MNSRERVIRAVEFDCPDRIPVVHTHLQAAVLHHGEELFSIYRRFPQDFGPSEYPGPFETRECPPDYRREYTDEWGTVWLEVYEGILGHPIGCPLEDWSAYERFQVPAVAEVNIDELRKGVRKHQEQWYCFGGGGTLFERLQQLRGFENVLCDLLTGEPLLGDLADRIVEHTLAVSLPALKAGVDAVHFADDWGTQEQLLASPKVWRDFFRPRYQRLFDAVHEHGAHAWFHSDGMILEIVDDFIEMGLDVLNPQFSCMDLDALAAKTRGKLAISTDVDRQYRLHSGTPEEMRLYVKGIIDTLNTPQGGLIARGEAGADVKLENLEAMFQAFSDFGRYGG